MKAESEEDIKAHLDRALETHTVVICILKGGLTETEHFDSKDAVIYKKIEFQPKIYYNGYYAGRMFYPNGKSQGEMDFNIKSFESVVCLEEA
jgi:hypothetical protein